MTEYSEQTPPKSMVDLSPLRRLIESWARESKAEQGQKCEAEFLQATAGRWAMLLGKVDRVVAAGGSGMECYDEEVWTFLTAAAYAASGSDGTQALMRRLIGGVHDDVTTDSVWLEYLPLPPRRGEGNTNLDLAAGAICRRGTTQGGIAYDPSKDVTGDPHRNQLIRVIENAVTFQDANGKPPASVYVTLVTPEVFRDRPVMSRLYAYKYAEYSAGNGPAAMLRELDACRLSEYAPTTGWKYPKRDELEQRLRAIKLNWVTYEELIRGAPQTPVADAVREFEARFNRTDGKKLPTEDMP